MAKEPQILAEGLVDEIPEADIRPTKYQHHIDEALNSGKRKWIHCKDRLSAEAVYAGIKRARAKTGANVTVRTVTHPDSKVSVYITPNGTAPEATADMEE